MLCVLFAFILLAMLAMAIAGKSRFPLVNRTVAAVVLPVEEGLTSLGSASDGLRGFWKALTVLQSENKKLKEENEELRSANIRMASLFAENKQLHTLLNYKEEHKTQQVVAAKVIARNFGDLQDCMYINVGKDKGLAPDMAWSALSMRFMMIMRVCCCLARRAAALVRVLSVRIPVL